MVPGLDEQLGQLALLSGRSLGTYLKEIETDMASVESELEAYKARFNELLTNLNKRTQTLTDKIMEAEKEVQGRQEAGVSPKEMETLRILLVDITKHRVVLNNLRVELTRWSGFIPQHMRHLFEEWRVPSWLVDQIPGISATGTEPSSISAVIGRIGGKDETREEPTLSKIWDHLRTPLNSELRLADSIDAIKGLISFAWFVQIMKDEGLPLIAELVCRKEAEGEKIYDLLCDIEEGHSLLMSRFLEAS